MAKKIKFNKWNLLVEIIKDPDRKSLIRIIYELFFLYCISRELPTHYFGRYLFKKNAINIRGFLPNRFAEKIVPFFNDKKFKEVLDNKFYFDLFYRQFNIIMPEILMYNHKKVFFVGTDRYEVNSLNDFSRLLDVVFEKNPSYNSIFIKKNYASSGGNNTYKLSRIQLKAAPEIIDRIYSEIIKSEYIFQEAIKQHHKLDELNSSCLNTMRIDTFLDEKGKIDVISGYLRMSLNDLHIDNISAGGCMVGIDIQTGKLKNVGFPNIRTHGVKLLYEHPLTRVKFEEFSIPFFTQVKDLVIKSACYTPGLRLIGWDVAIGESGPVLIEGNSDYALTGNDLSEGGYLTNIRFKKVMDEMKHKHNSNNR